MSQFQIFSIFGIESYRKSMKTSEYLSKVSNSFKSSNLHAEDFDSFEKVNDLHTINTFL